MFSVLMATSAKVHTDTFISSAAGLDKPKFTQHPYVKQYAVESQHSG